MQQRPRPRFVAPDTRHIGTFAGASVIVTVALWFAVLALALAASVAADPPGSDQHATTNEPSGNAGGGPAPAGHRLESPPGREPDRLGDLTEWPTGATLLALLPEAEPGHDKCKKRNAGRALRPWCFGLSSWPVLKAQAVTATVTGIHDVFSGPRPTPRKKPRPMDAQK